MLLVILAVIFSGMAFRIAGVPVDATGPMRVAAPDIIAGLVSWVAFIAAFVVILRVGFFIPPTIVAEDGGGLRRSFELTRGNVLRAFAVIAVLGVPVLLLLLGGEAVVLRSALGPALYGLSPAEFFRRAGEAMEQKLLPWEVFTGVIFVLGSALIYGGTAMAYRARIGNPDIRPPR
jgi:hypothetical protein